MRGAIVVRADGSQYHVFNVAPPGLQPGASNSPNSTYRLQSLPVSLILHLIFLLHLILNLFIS